MFSYYLLKNVMRSDSVLRQGVIFEGWVLVLAMAQEWAYYWGSLLVLVSIYFYFYKTAVRASLEAGDIWLVS